MERILKMQILAQASGIPGIDADVHQPELAPVLPADAAEQRHAFGNFLVNVGHQLLRHLQS